MEPTTVIEEACQPTLQLTSKTVLPQVSSSIPNTQSLTSFESCSQVDSPAQLLFEAPVETHPETTSIESVLLIETSSLDAPLDSPQVIPCTAYNLLQPVLPTFTLYFQPISEPTILPIQSQEQTSVDSSENQNELITIMNEITASSSKSRSCSPLMQPLQPSKTPKAHLSEEDYNDLLAVLIGETIYNNSDSNEMIVSETFAQVDEPEKGYQPIPTIHELISLSTSLTSLDQTMGLISPSQSQSPLTTPDYLTTESSSSSSTHSPLYPSETASLESASLESASLESTSPQEDNEIETSQSDQIPEEDPYKRRTIIYNKSKEVGKIFHFNYIRRGEILDGEELEAELKSYLVKCPNPRIAYYAKCICPDCIGKGYSKQGRRNRLFEHIKATLNIKILCIYCKRLFETEHGVRDHIRRNHWQLGIPFINTHVDSE